LGHSASAAIAIYLGREFNPAGVSFKIISHLCIFFIVLLSKEIVGKNMAKSAVGVAFQNWDGDR
jgi:hypothetical protein